MLLSISKHSLKNQNIIFSKIYIKTHDIGPKNKRKQFICIIWQLKKKTISFSSFVTRLENLKDVPSFIRLYLAFWYTLVWVKVSPHSPTTLKYTMSLFVLGVFFVYDLWRLALLDNCKTLDKCLSLMCLNHADKNVIYSYYFFL